MGGRFSHVHYREQDAAVVPHFQLLTQVWYVLPIQPVVIPVALRYVEQLS